MTRCSRSLPGWSITAVSAAPSSRTPCSRGRRPSWLLRPTASSSTARGFAGSSPARNSCRGEPPYREDFAIMGITIAYRGRLADLARVEDFEDRVLDLALEFGGQAQIWRSFADYAPRRIVRGVILNLAPGLESTSLLFSPEGWIIGLTDIKDA